MAVVAVPVAVGGLVGAPEARVVGQTTTRGPPSTSGPSIFRYRKAQVGSPWKQTTGRPAALVHVVQPQPVDIGVVRLEVEPRQPLEPLVRGAEDVHAAEPTLSLPAVSLRGRAFQSVYRRASALSRSGRYIWIVVSVTLSSSANRFWMSFSSISSDLGGVASAWPRVSLPRNSSSDFVA